MSLIYRTLFPSLIWRLPSTDTIYLTFDDGPIPELTPWVLAQLDQYDASATLFCVGDNARKYPDLFNALINSRHAIGNHSMRHLDGWKTKDEKYLEDIHESKNYISSNLFRPPYGKISFSQAKKLRKDFSIIMWDVLSRDYDLSVTGEQCFETVKKKTRPGSILVFHDSLKAESRLRIVLPKTLAYFSSKGYKFGTIRLP
jgi:peptidoglycan/xylan/chitin deacetylase (PgdA/CDA1 family)